MSLWSKLGRIGKAFIMPGSIAAAPWRAAGSAALKGQNVGKAFGKAYTDINLPATAGALAGAGLVAAAPAVAGAAGSVGGALGTGAAGLAKGLGGAAGTAGKVLRGTAGSGAINWDNVLKLVGTGVSLMDAIQGSKTAAQGQRAEEDLLKQLQQQRQLGALIGQRGAVGNPFGALYAPLFQQAGFPAPTPLRQPGAPADLASRLRGHERPSSSSAMGSALQGQIAQAQPAPPSSGGPTPLPHLLRQRRRRS